MWKGMALHLGRADDGGFQVAPVDEASGRRTTLGLLLNNRKSETLYEATADQFEQLRNHRLDHIELNYRADGELIKHEFPFGRGNGGKMQKFAGCVLDATL